MTRNDFMKAVYELYEAMPDKVPGDDDLPFKTIRWAVAVAGLVVFDEHENLMRELWTLLADFASRHKAQLDHLPEDK